MKKIIIIGFAVMLSGCAGVARRNYLHGLSDGMVLSEKVYKILNNGMTCPEQMSMLRGKYDLKKMKIVKSPVDKNIDEWMKLAAEKAAAETDEQLGLK
jgi:hypothetical protein